MRRKAHQVCALSCRIDGTVLAEGHALLLEGFLEQPQSLGSHAM